MVVFPEVVMESRPTTQMQEENPWRPVLVMRAPMQLHGTHLFPQDNDKGHFRQPLQTKEVPPLPELPVNVSKHQFHLLQSSTKRQYDTDSLGIFDDFLIRFVHPH
ncbi:unnamed protein product [Caenorhabditis auriculariae]|uniref:Uncharacterized protein n=1 Tax=Caenorhabditis auriculariae TaxID=2777116 RepID=A0A8S1H230_9PELO|nr:unnamed protein product [Caenorhabditis auriculariae]